VRGVPPLQRFWAKVRKTEGCWLWTDKPRKDGYGALFVNGHPVLAHRFAYELLVGPVPDGKGLDHVKARGCTNRHCVNPAHLEPVTTKENVLRGDGLTAHKARQVACIHGHAFTEENTYHKPKGGRGCKECRRNNVRLSREKRIGARL
jgi:hypothetical protein